MSNVFYQLTVCFAILHKSFILLPKRTWRIALFWLQQEDLLALGQLLLALACNSLLAIRDEHLATSLELLARYYSADFLGLVHYLLGISPAANPHLSRGANSSAHLHRLDALFTRMLYFIPIIRFKILCLCKFIKFTNLQYYAKHMHICTSTYRFIVPMAFVAGKVQATSLPHSIIDIMPFIGARFYTYMEATSLRADLLEAEVCDCECGLPHLTESICFFDSV